MTRSPLSETQIRNGLQRAWKAGHLPQADEGESTLKVSDEGISDELVSEYHRLLCELQQKFESRLSDMLFAAIDPSFPGLELVEESETMYVFRAGTGFWKPIADDLELDVETLSAVQYLYEQAFFSPGDWTVLIVEKPDAYQAGMEAVIAEFNTLLDQGMRPDDAFEYLSKKHLSEDSFPVSDGPVSQTERDWLCSMFQKARNVLFRSPSES